MAATNWAPQIQAFRVCSEGVPEEEDGAGRDTSPAAGNCPRSQPYRRALRRRMHSRQQNHHSCRPHSCPHEHRTRRIPQRRCRLPLNFQVLRGRWSSQPSTRSARRASKRAVLLLRSRLRALRTETRWLHRQGKRQRCRREFFPNSSRPRFARQARRRRVPPEPRRRISAASAGIRRIAEPGGGHTT